MMKQNLALLLICTVFFSACASTQWVRTPVAKEYALSVNLEQRQGMDAISPQNYQQPLSMDLDALKKLMGDLAYAEKAGLMSESKQRPVFQSDEIERLAPLLVGALAKADASQRLRFISYNQVPGAIFSESRKTEGVVLVDSAGRLNIAFNYINAKRLPSETSAIYSSYSEVDPLQVGITDTPIVSLPLYAELGKLENGNQAPMWIMADINKLKDAVATMVAPVDKTPGKVVPPVSPQTVAAGPPAEKPVPPRLADDSLKADIKSKLKYLKELMGEGLISEQDYNAKKAELLKKLD